MSIELLDRTRKISRLLAGEQTGFVDFSDICGVVGSGLASNVYIISANGKILGAYKDGATDELVGFSSTKGSRIDSGINERLLGVLSTKENVNIETLGFEEYDAEGWTALISPILVGGDRLGTLFLYRRESIFHIDDIILCEYCNIVVGLELLRAMGEEMDINADKNERIETAMMALSPLEKKAVGYVLSELSGQSGMLVTSRLAKEKNITRSVIVNALKKLESARLIKTKSSGVKGTHIELLHDIKYADFKK